MKFLKITIPEQKDIYRFKNNLYSYGMKFNSKKRFYYNPYELHHLALENLVVFLKENDYVFKQELVDENDFIKEIEFQYRLEAIDERNYFVIKRKSSEKIYFLNYNFENILTLVDLKNNQSFFKKVSLNQSEEINPPLIALKLLNNLKEECKFLELGKILSVLIDYNNDEYRFENRLQSFKFHIFGMVKNKMQDGFLCNCVDGFFPETNFYARGTKIYSDYLNSEVSFEQEKKILKYLYVNRKYIGIRKNPTYKDLFIGKQIVVNDKDGFVSKVVINRVKRNSNGLLDVFIFNGNNLQQIARPLSQSSLQDLVIKSRSY